MAPLEVNGMDCIGVEFSSGVTVFVVLVGRLSEYNSRTCPFSPILKDTSPGSTHIVRSLGR